MTARNTYQAKWARNRRRLIAYGRWNPTTHIDANPAREHVHNLRTFGLSISTIERLAGESRGRMADLIYGQQRTISPERAQRILAVRFNLDDLPANGLVDAAGTRRRIEALMCNGWSYTDMGAAIGSSRQLVAKHHHASHVKAETAWKIRDLYARLWDQPGPDARAVNRARRLGYVPALAWDDDSIDDPTATPHDITPPKRKSGGQGRPARDVAEDVEFLLTHNPLATSIEIAARLGYADQTGVQNALAADRANRPDLLARLARNAEIAGLNVTRRSA